MVAKTSRFAKQISQPTMTQPSNAESIIVQSANRNGGSRARLSAGSSHASIYSAVASALHAAQIGGGTLVDVGCGNGALWAVLRSSFDRYIGVDAVRYRGFPADGDFVMANLDEEIPALPDECGGAVVAVETIEHLENPRAFMRKLSRLAKSGGAVLVTTPNQLSLLSKMTLVVKNQFNQFQERPGLYPAHITALLEIDLLRIAHECGLTQATTRYSDFGRIPFTSLNWPRWLGGRTFSDNVILVARKPGGPRRS
jgi:2-polyprenyl-3-methyl-5-hydroxy-6-metoxy-1,4-benzoquinol methylase